MNFHSDQIFDGSLGPYHENDNVHGPMKVFIINQPVKNVIQAGNNLIVETEASIKTEEMPNNTNETSLNRNEFSTMRSSSIPNNNFDASRRKFSEDELRPAPMRTKTKKRPVPDVEKDNSYWERRKKNNMAAKRSRESRRNRDNQVTERTAYLEDENFQLKNRITEIRSEILEVKEKLQQYQVLFRDSGVQKQINNSTDRF